MRSVWPCQAATTSAAMPAARIREMLLCRSLPSVIAESPAAVRWAANSREYSRTGSHVPSTRESNGSASVRGSAHSQVLAQVYRAHGRDYRQLSRRPAVASPTDRSSSTSSSDPTAHIGFLTSHIGESFSSDRSQGWLSGQHGRSVVHCEDAHGVAGRFPSAGRMWGEDET